MGKHHYNMACSRKKSQAEKELLQKQFKRKLITGSGTRKSIPPPIVFNTYDSQPS
jgi:hypothetical protein